MTTQRTRAYLVEKTNTHVEIAIDGDGGRLIFRAGKGAFSNRTPSGRYCLGRGTPPHSIKGLRFIPLSEVSKEPSLVDEVDIAGELEPIIRERCKVLLRSIP